MERNHGEGVEGTCRKDKGHCLLYRPEPLSLGAFCNTFNLHKAI